MSEYYDYVIVGGGAAGCVLANRLSEDPRQRVLVIEAGPPDCDPFIAIPMGFGKVVSDPKLMWYFPTEPDEGNGQRAGIWMRGKTLGGSSSVNGMLYCRGEPPDYDGWEAAGAVGWGWRDIGRCFREIEDHGLGGDELRGSGGPLKVSRQPNRNAVTAALLQAGAEMGWPIREDLNRLELGGIGYSLATMRDGRRVSAADAFLRPALSRPNLHIVTDTRVDRILFEGKRAVGVAAVGKRGPVEYLTRGEVILSAGAVQSPKLLMLSGIGPAEHLSSLGIPVVADAREVGRNLREHKSLTMQFRLASGLGLNREMRGWRAARNFLRYKLSRGGPLAGTFEVMAFIKSRPELPRADIQLIFGTISLDLASGGVALEKLPGLMASVVIMRPDSAGHMMLRSPDPEAPPLIYANFLATDSDRRAMIGGIRQVRDMMARPPIRPLVVAETAPGSSFRSDEELLTAARNGDTMAHAVGSCRLGTDASSVVDERLRVRGVSGLRVMDTSVMPTQVSGNTGGPVTAMAWRAGELIREGA